MIIKYTEPMRGCLLSFPLKIEILVIKNYSDKLHGEGWQVMGERSEYQ